MLSDAIRILGERFKAGVRNDDPTGMLLTFSALEMEARNMENRIEAATRRPHVPLDGNLMSLPMIGGGDGRHV